MHPLEVLEVIMIMSSTAMLLITALLLIVRTMPSKSGIECWLYGAFVQAIIYVIAYVTHPMSLEGAGAIMFFTMQTLVCRGMSLGVLKFIDKPVNLKLRLAMTLSVILGIIVLAIQVSVWWASVLFVAYAAATLFQVAYHLYRLEDKTLTTNVVMVLFSLNALHWLDYPILGQIPWFVPIGFMIGMIMVVATFLSLCALALMQFKTQTEASEQRAIQAAIHDPLTGLYNRSYLDQLFEEYAEESEQIQRPFILLYFDLDGFKYVNDTYGHAAGDLILTTVSKRMSKFLGSKGDAIRVGGDELVVLTRLRADFSTQNALPAAQRLLNLIEQPIVDGKHTYEVSASVGGCCYGIPFTKLDCMIHEADKLMYAAKQAGGRRVNFASMEADSLIEQSKRHVSTESPVESG